MRSPEPPDPSSPTPRPSGKRNAQTPTNNTPVRKASDNSKPPWGSSAGARAAPSPAPASGTSTALHRQQKLSAPTPVASKLAPPSSPAPSELTQDSGVGFYRAILAHDPPLNKHSGNMLSESH